jgi:hypothetical protein
MGGFGIAALLARLVNMLRLLFATQAGRWIVSAMAFIGINWTTQKVIAQPLMDQVRSMLNSSPAGDFGATALAWCGVLRFDQAITMLLSAIVIKKGMDATKLALSRVQT